MDRLETNTPYSKTCFYVVFTFQYGQIRNKKYFNVSFACYNIYIPVWIDQKLKRIKTVSSQGVYLHSSMDRLETKLIVLGIGTLNLFTFQYGQIRNYDIIDNEADLFSFTFQYGQIRNKKREQKEYLPFQNLHSSMDRLETNDT